MSPKEAVMAKFRTFFEELGVQLQMTGDRTTQDEILDRWLAYEARGEVLSDLAYWELDPELLMPRQRAALEPRLVRRVKFMN